METLPFLRAIAKLNLPPVERAVALLWYYTATQQFEERTAGELVRDLAEAGFPKMNSGRLEEQLRGSGYVIRGRRSRSFRINLQQRDELDEKYGQFADVRVPKVSDVVLPMELVRNSLPHLERLALQINGSYDFGFFDACAVLCRRVIESLIIQIYLHQRRAEEIRGGGVFLALERLIGKIEADSLIVLSRNAPRYMREVKQVGDTAAHDRSSITLKQDIDDIKLGFRKIVQELLGHAGLPAKPPNVNGEGRPGPVADQ